MGLLLAFPAEAASMVGSLLRQLPALVMVFFPAGVASKAWRRLWTRSCRESALQLAALDSGL
jgi:hypothetical protein